MPKEVFSDSFVNGNSLVVKWGSWGTVEIATEADREFVYPFAVEGEEPETMRGWYLSLSRDELQRLIKVLTKAARQYDDVSDRGDFSNESPVESPVESAE